MSTDKVFMTFAELKKAISNSWNSSVACVLVFPREIMWQQDTIENVMQWVLAEMPDGDRE